MKFFAILVFVVTLALGLIHLALPHAQPATAKATVEALSEHQRLYSRHLPSSKEAQDHQRELEQQRQEEERKQHDEEQRSLIELYTRIGVTIVLGAACLYIALASKSEVAAKHFAYTTMGTIVGFWLGGSK
jgi:hypothetical protein